MIMFVQFVVHQQKCLKKKIKDSKVLYYFFLFFYNKYIDYKGELMEEKKEKKVFIPLLIMACLFIIGAFFTISISMAMPNPNVPAWKIGLFNIKYDNSLIKNLVYYDNGINSHVLLEDFNDEIIITADIQNTGEVDAKIKELNFTDLSSIKVGELEDKSFYLSDFLEYQVRYGADNQENNVKKDYIVMENDLIKANTFNIIEIILKYKDINFLNKEQIEFLNSLQSRALELDFMFSLKLKEA